MPHNFITVCTNHDKPYQDLKVELEQIRSWAVELQVACEALEAKFVKLEAVGSRRTSMMNEDSK